MADRVTDLGPSLVLGAAHEVIAETDAGYLSPPVVLSTTTSLLVRLQAEALATAAPSATATPAPTPEAIAAATPEPEIQSAYFTYTVQPGDTVSSIGESFGVDPQYIVWNNPLVGEDPDLLIIGAEILIPSVNGVVYTVTLGDTLSDIASYYQIDVQSIAAFVPNRLSSADSVIEGMVLVLPGAVPPPPPLPAAVAVLEEPPPAGGGEPPAAADPPPYSSTGFIWPYYASISQYFSGYHRGIDIDGFGNYGATIVAAADGVVVLAAYMDWGYGNHVIIEHADGSRTLYGHLSDIWVGQGQYVGQGEGIGALGSTGYSTGPHLHFEIHVGGPVDPLAYLP
jgi:murein DD-endopeptidase MepM/ murein hydrolase activator NlpD